MRWATRLWGGDRLGVGGAQALLLEFAIAAGGGGGARGGDEGARRRRNLVGEALDIAFGAVEEGGRDVEMARLVGLGRFLPVARQRRERMAHTQ